MGNKVKPWHRRKPKYHDRHEDDRRKRISPLRAGGDRRIIPLTVDSSRVVPLTTTGDDFDLDEGPWEN